MDGVSHTKVDSAHEDERRSLFAIFNDDFVAKQLKLLKIKSGVELGNHYHEYGEMFYLLEGQAKYTFENIETKERLVLYLKAGDRVVIEPKIAHKAVYSQPTIMIECTMDPYVSAEVNDHVYKIED